MYEVMIIGAGPAGLCAAVYAARKRLSTLLVSGDIGGQINWTMGVENYLGYQFIEGPVLIAKFQEQVSQYPIDQKIGYEIVRVTRAEKGFMAAAANGENFLAQTVIFATGKRPRRLGVPGEKEFTGKGLSYCAVCDGPLFSGQRVAVIGGGNSGIQAALDMVKIATHVDVITHKLTADPILIERLLTASNVSIFSNHHALSIAGDKFVSGVNIADQHLGDTIRIEVSGIFVEIGLEPNSAAARDLVKLNEWGEISVNCSGETNVPAFFAAGDVTDVPEKQIVVAAGEGAKAVLQAHRYLLRLGK